MQGNVGPMQFSNCYFLFTAHRLRHVTPMTFLCFPTHRNNVEIEDVLRSVPQNLGAAAPVEQRKRITSPHARLQRL